MTEAPHQNIHDLTAAFLADYSGAHPSLATQMGLHRDDHTVEDVSRAALDARTRELSAWLDRVAAVDRRTLDGDQRDELRLLEAHARAELLRQDEFRSWQQDPTSYITVAGNAMHSLISRDFAPLRERLQAALDRALLLPALFDQAQANLDRPPRIVTEAALEQLGDTLELFEQELPRAFAPVEDPTLSGRFDAANQRVLDALRRFGAFLREELLPRSDGDFAVGERGMLGLLRYEDLVYRPLAELIAAGRQELAATQERLVETASRLNPHHRPAEIMEAISQDHPTADQMVPEAAALIEGLRTFCREQDLVTFATEAPIRCEASPSFMRFFGFAYCDTPGPFEDVATEAYFYLTPPDPSWPGDRIAAYLRFFNRSFLPIIALHETYPGHYVHLPWVRQAPGVMARAFSSTATVEGWAHYCEEMMLEEGYGAGDLKLRLTQLQAALLRLCRYLVALQLHTGALTYAEAVDFFMEQGYAERVVAEREVRRGALNPTIYAYTLGKLEILELRDAYRARTGSRFRLKDFHDRLMQTPLPLPLIRERLLAEGPA